MLRASATSFTSSARLTQNQLALWKSFRGSVCLRAYSVAAFDAQDQRARLTSELKNAMKSRNAFASTVLRSVLSEVYAADKGESGPVSSSQITSIIKKGIARRTASADQFISASRPELAEKERNEVELLNSFLPAAMPIENIDAVIQKVIKEQNLAGLDSKRAMGLLLMNFFLQIDKSLVDGQVVKQRAQIALEALQVAA